MSLGWYSTHENERKGWTCGYCGKDVGGVIGYTRNPSEDNGDRVYICPRCECPTAFVIDEHGETHQIPGAVYGNPVGNLPESVASLYAEVRRCIQYTAYTSAVLSLRKLLMHVAVECGAEKDQQFVKYVDFLDSEHYIPPSAREWVDTLRTYGNDATHQIVLMSEGEAKRLLDFAEMLLKLVYEFPARNVTV